MKISLYGNNDQHIKKFLNTKKLKHIGYYKWFAIENDFNTINSALLLTPEQISHVEKIDDKYCIYVGIAISEKLNGRLKRHIFGNNKCSTLRKSISAILKTNDNTKINDFIRRMEVEYSNPINKDKLLNIEKSKINEYYRPINIQKNNYEVDNLSNETKRVKSRLRLLRKEVSQIIFNDI